mgnify:CR=1 FL=1
MKKTPIHALTMVVILFVFCWLMIERAKADDLFGGSEFFSEPSSKSESNSIWKSDGSLVSWGNDSHGAVSNTPTTNDFTQVAAGSYHSVAIRQ